LSIESITASNAAKWLNKSGPTQIGSPGSNQLDLARKKAKVPIGCTRYRKEGERSLYCGATCRDGLSDFLRGIDLKFGLSDDHISEMLVSRLKQCDLLLKATD